MSAIRVLSLFRKEVIFEQYMGGNRISCTSRFNDWCAISLANLYGF